MHRAEYERHVIAWFVGAVFAGLAVSQSLLFVLLTFCLSSRQRKARARKSHLACLILSCWSAAQVLLAVHQMLQHLIYYRQPLLQKVGVHSMPDAVSHPIRTVVADRWPA